MTANNKAKHLIEQLFSRAQITINGPNPWDITVHNSQLYSRLIREPELGLGESYMDGWWDCPRVDEFIARLLRSGVERGIWRDRRFFYAHMMAKLVYWKTRLLNFQSKQRAYMVGEHHYDIGNNVYQVMLDKRMNYSCGYWPQSKNLDEAQEAKLELICKKLQLAPGMKVLDIGCGWGGFSKYAAEKYQVSVVGLTISKQQQQLAQTLCAGLPVTIRYQDYRELNEKFDRICSIGMFEHVGYKNYRTYMQIVRNCLADEGLFLLHTIGNNFSATLANPWFNKYIFPNGALPSIQQIGRAAENLLVMEDWHNFGSDYEKTLLAWWQNFTAHWDSLKEQYGERFRRMWDFYLLSCAGSFRARDMQLWQIVFSKQGVIGGYRSVR